MTRSLDSLIPCAVGQPAAEKWNDKAPMSRQGGEANSRAATQVNAVSASSTPPASNPIQLDLFPGRAYTINVSIVDIETAKVLKAADFQFKGASDNLLSRGIPDVVNRLMLNKRRKSHKVLYLVGGGIITAGVVGFILSFSSKEKGAGSTGAQTGTITFTISDPTQ